jgi:3-oxoacyl-[acyl-carrier-protein] synthase III
MTTYSRITQTASYPAPREVKNSFFEDKELYYADETSPSGFACTRKTADKIFKVTGMLSRRWAEEGQTGLDLAVQACAGITIAPDAVIYAHNGKLDNGAYSPIPAVAARLQGRCYPNANAFDVLSNGTLGGAMLARAYELTKTKNVQLLTRPELASHIGESPASLCSRINCPNNEQAELLIVDHQERLGVPRAQLLAQRLNYKKTDTLDVISGCPGFVVGIDIADRLIKAGIYERILVVGAEKLTDLADPDCLDRTLYADGAGAILLEKSEKPGILGSHFVTNGKLWDCLRLGKGIKDKTRQFLAMQGSNVYSYVAKELPKITRALLGKTGFTLNDVAALIMHQMNGRLMKTYVSELTCLPDPDAYINEHVPWTVDQFGNCSVATNPIVLDLVLRDKLKKRCTQESFELALGSGKTIACVSAGAGIIGGGFVAII